LIGRGKYQHLGPMCWLIKKAYTYTNTYQLIPYFRPIPIIGLWVFGAILAWFQIVNTDTCQEQWVRSKLISKTNSPPSSNVVLKQTALKFGDEFSIVAWLWDCPTPVLGGPLISILFEDKGSIEDLISLRR